MKLSTDSDARSVAVRDGLLDAAHVADDIEERLSELASQLPREEK